MFSRRHGFFEFDPSLCTAVHEILTLKQSEVLTLEGLGCVLDTEAAVSDVCSHMLYV